MNLCAESIGTSLAQIHPRNPAHGHLENVELDDVAVKLDSRIMLNVFFYVLFVDFFIPDIVTSNLDIVSVANALGPGRV